MNSSANRLLSILMISVSNSNSSCMDLFSKLWIRSNVLFTPNNVFCNEDSIRLMAWESICPELQVFIELDGNAARFLDFGIFS